MNPSCNFPRAQLEYQLEQERHQRAELEKSRRRLEGDSRSSQDSLGEMEKMRNGLEDLIKRSVKDALHAYIKLFRVDGEKSQSAKVPFAPDTNNLRLKLHSVKLCWEILQRLS